MQGEEKSKEQSGDELAALRQEVAELRASEAECQQVRKALEESEARYRQLMELSPDAIFVHCQGCFAFINPAGSRMLGAGDPTELIGREVMDFVHPDYRQAVEQRVRQVLEQENALDTVVQERLFRLDGKAIDVEVAAAYMTYQGQPAILVIARDITGRVQAQSQRDATLEALRRAEWEKEIILDSQLEHVVYQDRENRILWPNQAACESVNATRAELIGRYCYEIWSHGGERCQDCPVALAIDTGRQQEIEKTTPDGRAWFIRGYPVRDANGEIVGAIEVTQEITERVSMEEALRRRAEELDALQATVLDITTSYDLPTLLETIVERAVRLLNGSGGGMYLCQPDRNTVRCVVSHNTPGDYTGTELEYGEGAAGIVAQTGEPLVVDDYRAWRGRAAVYEEEQPFTAIISAPMIWKGQVTGVIHVLDNAERRRFSQAELELLTLFANHASIAIHNVQLYEQTQARSRYLETMQQISATLRSTLPLEEVLETIARGAGQALGCTGSFITIPDEKGERLVLGAIWGSRFIEAAIRFTGLEVGAFNLPLAAEENPIVQTFLTGQLHHQSGEPERIVLGVKPRIPQRLAAPIASAMGGNSVACVPLSVGEKAVGVLLVISPREELSDEERAILLGLADQAGLAIHNAGLYQSAQQELAERRRAEKALRASEKKYRELYENLRDASATVNMDGEIIEFNHIFQEMLRYSAEEMYQLTYQDITPSEWHTAEAKIIEEQVLQRGYSGFYEKEYMRKDGSVFPVELRTFLMRDDSGHLTGMGALVRDISERKQAEDALRWERDRALALEEAAAVVSSTLDPDQVLDRILEQVSRVVPNDAVNILLVEGDRLRVVRWRGYESFDAGDLVSSLDLPVSEVPILQEMMETQEPVVVPDTVTYPGWVRIPPTEWVRSYASAPIIVRNEVIGFLNVDGATPGFFTEAHAETLRVFANHAAAALENARLYEAEHKRRQIADTLRQASSVFNSTLELDEVLNLILGQLHQVIYFDTASVQRLRGEYLEIAACRGFEEPDNVVGLVFPLDPKFPNHRVVTTNAALAVEDIAQDYAHFQSEADTYESGHIRSWLGVPLVVKDQVIGMIALDRVAVDPFSADETQLAIVFANQAAIAMENARLFEETERYRAFNEGIVQTVSDAIVMTNVDGIFTFINPATAELLDCAPEDVLGQHWSVICPPDQQPIIRAADERRMRGESDRYEVELVRQDGVRVPTLASGSPWLDTTTGHFAGTLAVFTDISERVRAEEALRESEERYRQLVQHAPAGIYEIDLTTGKFLSVNNVMCEYTGYTEEEFLSLSPFEILTKESLERYLERQAQFLAGEPVPETVEYRIKGKSGQEFSVLLNSRLQYDDRGTPAPATVVVHDITERKRLEEQLRQAQKMEAVGLLAGGIAHDFNNLLTAINGFAELLQFQLAPNDPVQELAGKIRSSGARAADLVSQLMAFSRKQIIQPRVLNLNKVVADVERMLRRIIGEDINLVCKLKPDLWPVEIDPTQFEQVIVNLAINARDAMPGGGKLTIETDSVILDQAFVADHLGMQAGEHVVLTVSDTGVGMSEEIRAHIFEPFFTTKEMGKGTGLGLATVYGIVKQSGGDIHVYSEEENGTTFTIYLPRAKEGARPSLQTEFGRSMPSGGETILLVEDDDEVRDLAQLVLQRQGYTVLEARHGERAIQLAADHSGPIHLLLTDVVMPGMSGATVAERLAETYPDLRVLFMSGYTDDAIAHHGVLESGIAFLPKPFSSIDLARKVRAILDA